MLTRKLIKSCSPSEFAICILKQLLTASLYNTVCVAYIQKNVNKYFLSEVLI